ncbi:hypothetical protein C8R44DRAFT_913840 [Mycena epipterygia]|nr:hypothetical protein C8R44DRAFT_913840 [Mycena epipterygia]
MFTLGGKLTSNAQNLYDLVHLDQALRNYDAAKGVKPEFKLEAPRRVALLSHDRTSTGATPRPVQPIYAGAVKGELTNILGSEKRETRTMRRSSKRPFIPSFLLPCEAELIITKSSLCLDGIAENGGKNGVKVGSRDSSRCELELDMHMLGGNVGTNFEDRAKKNKGTRKRGIRVFVTFRQTWAFPRAAGGRDTPDSGFVALLRAASKSSKLAIPAKFISQRMHQGEFLQIRTGRLPCPLVGQCVLRPPLLSRVNLDPVVISSPRRDFPPCPSPHPGFVLHPPSRPPWLPPPSTAANRLVRNADIDARPINPSLSQSTRSREQSRVHAEEEVVAAKESGPRSGGGGYGDGNERLSQCRPSKRRQNLPAGKHPKGTYTEFEDAARLEETGRRRPGGQPAYATKSRRPRRRLMGLSRRVYLGHGAPSPRIRNPELPWTPRKEKTREKMYDALEDAVRRLAVVSQTSQMRGNNIE